ncbi:MAG TPA: lysine--tRNA ligase [Gemmatimonadota bacterium]|nr:lysine--tRNA ligase [Gemmatimonadota bacterium]
MTTPSREAPVTDPVAARVHKLEQLEREGVDAYPVGWKPSHSAAGLIAAFRDDGPAVTGRVAGRVVSLRPHGRTTFLHLEDASGRIQVYLREDELEPDVYGLLDRLDLGDLVGVAGGMFRTRTGEVTLRAGEIRLLAKSLRPLPLGKVVEDEGGDARAYHRVTDREFRYRQRYADLAVHPEVREVFAIRARIVRYLRDFLDRRGYLEVETPVLQPLYGGAAARPFETHHHALGVPLYLRIADELYLKRCVVGGLERVYEIAKDFRNEGIDRFHNPEFTMLEFYEAYADYHDFMELAEDMLTGLVEEIHGSRTLVWQGRPVDVSPPWPRLPFLDALSERGVDVDDLGRPALARQAARLGVEIAPGHDPGKILDALFKALVEPDLEAPTLVIDHPRLLSPLARRHRRDERLAERFEAYVFGTEWANAFSEQNDPRDQRARLEELAAAAAAGDLEAPVAVDEDFLRALEYGMAPTAGMGVGVDRLTMFVADQPTLRDVILFPILRPEAAGEGDPPEAGA